MCVGGGEQNSYYSGAAGDYAQSLIKGSLLTAGSKITVVVGNRNKTSSFGQSGDSYYVAAVGGKQNSSNTSGQLKIEGAEGGVYVGGTDNQSEGGASFFGGPPAPGAGSSAHQRSIRANAGYGIVIIKIYKSS